jgi:programmed cell death protein 5
MVKKDKARRIEDMLITQAHRGAIAGAIEEDQLIQMLESINEMEGKSKVGKVTIQRRRMDDDDDW